MELNWQLPSAGGLYAILESVDSVCTVDCGAFVGSAFATHFASDCDFASDCSFPFVIEKNNIVKAKRF